MLLTSLSMTRLFAAALCVMTLSSAPAADRAPAGPAWIASWATSPGAADPDPREPLLNLDGQTVRQRARLSIGGDRVRLRFTNEYGSTLLRIGSATVALPIDAASVRRESLRALTFSGRSSVTIPAGAVVLSDPVELAVASGTELSISLYLPQRIATPTLHSLALKRAVVSARGDFTHAERIEAQAMSESSVLLSAVLVPARAGQGLVVAIGDSVTDGDATTVDADCSWPSDLARRLNEKRRGPEIAVINEGIAGNRLLSDGPGINALGVSVLARFDRDVLSLPSVTHVVLQTGLNDIGFPGAMLGGRPLAAADEMPDADEIIAAYRQLIERAHARGVKIVGATLTPFEGVALPGYYSVSKERIRQTVNTWIRTAGAFDAVIDFDAVLRDPGNARRLQARYASGDGIHPNDAGYQAMADAVDPALFDAAETAASGRVFELDIYHVAPGKVRALGARFRDAAKLQAKHGLNVIGYWVPAADPAGKDTFIYIVAHASREEAERNWRAFHADPEFQKYVKAEATEQLIEGVDTLYMTATEYSQLQ